MLLLANMATCTYRFDLRRHIKEVYNSSYREVFREFVSIEEFESCLYRQDLVSISDQLHRYFSYGYRYLSQKADDGFVAFTHDDENINFNSVGFSEVKHYLLANAMEHLYASMALELMENTDIEDHLSPDYEIAYMDRWFMTFSYRD